MLTDAQTDSGLTVGRLENILPPLRIYRRGGREIEYYETTIIKSVLGTLNYA